MRASEDEPWVSQLVASSGSLPSMKCMNGNCHFFTRMEHWTLDDSQADFVAWRHKLQTERNARIDVDRKPY